MTVLGKRDIQSRGPVNLLRTLLTAAVETGALEAMFQSVSCLLSSERADSTAAITEGACSCSSHAKNRGFRVGRPRSPEPWADGYFRWR